MTVNPARNSGSPPGPAISAVQATPPGLAGCHCDSVCPRCAQRHVFGGVRDLGPGIRRQIRRPCGAPRDSERRPASAGSDRRARSAPRLARSCCASRTKPVATTPTVPKWPLDAHPLGPLRWRGSQVDADAGYAAYLATAVPLAGHAAAVEAPSPLLKRPSVGTAGHHDVPAGRKTPHSSTSGFDATAPTAPRRAQSRTVASGS